MPFKTALEAAIAHLIAQGVISSATDVAADLHLKSRGTVSGYATGAARMSKNFKTSFENKYGIRLSDFEHLVNRMQPPQENKEDDYKAQLITQLKKNVEVLERENLELRKKLDTDLLKIQEAMKINEAYLKSIHYSIQKLRAKIENTALDQIMEDDSKTFLEVKNAIFQNEMRSYSNIV